MNSRPANATELLQELIRIPSVNPDGSKDPDAAGEKDCAKWVGEFLRDAGAAVSFDEVLSDRPNVIGRFPHPTSRRGILFAPHTDTVSVSGMTIDPFGGVIRNGRIYGRGASDTKGTMAAMLWALYELREVLPTLTHPMAFVGLMGEEAGQPGSKHFAENHADEFEFAVVGEPTELETVYAHKGCVWLELIAEGISCHGSTPHLGENAIRKMLPVLEGLLPELEDRLGSFTDDTLGSPTVSLGGIQGGTSPNIVPSACSAILDCRETPALASAGGTLSLVQELLGETDEGKEIIVEKKGDSFPLLTDPGTDGILKLQSIGSKLVTAPWFCDAGRLGEKGLAAVACGPGKIAQAHTKDEFLAIEDLEAGVEFYKKFILTYQEN